MKFDGHYAPYFAVLRIATSATMTSLLRLRTSWINLYNISFKFGQFEKNFLNYALYMYLTS